MMPWNPKVGDWYGVPGTSVFEGMNLIRETPSLLILNDYDRMRPAATA